MTNGCDSEMFNAISLSRIKAESLHFSLISITSLPINRGKTQRAENVGIVSLPKYFWPIILNAHDELCKLRRGHEG